MTKQAIGKYRWVIATLLLFATTINYMDRQVISYLKPFYSSPVEQGGFGWTNIDFSVITSVFTAFYAIVTILAGFVIDKIGTKLGLALSLIIWSVFGIVNAFAGATVAVHAMIRSLFGIGEAGNFPASIKTVAEWFPKKERALATGIFNSGSNLGAMISALFVPWCLVYFGTGSGWKMAFIITGAVGFIWLIFWFMFYDTPTKQKRLSKEEFDYIHSDEATVSPEEDKGSGVSYGNLISFNGRVSKASFWGTFLLINIVCIFILQVISLIIGKTHFGELFGMLFSQSAEINVTAKFIIYGVFIVYVWLVLALQSRRLHDLGKDSKLLFINLIPVVGFLYVLFVAGSKKGDEGTNQFGETPSPSILAYNQTWSFFFGKFFTDGVWWFYLFWLPDYLIKQFGMAPADVKWPSFIVYGIAIIGSVFGGSVPLLLINKGMQVYKARLTAMLIFAIIPLTVLSTQYFGNVEHFGTSAMYLAVTVICIGAAAHQAWSANLFTTVSDMFPKKAVGSVTGIGAMAGGLGGVLVQLLAGRLNDFYKATPQQAYLIMFVFCGLAYLTAWAIMKVLVPRHKPITDI